MRRYSLSYFIGQSFKGLVRNGVMSLASVLVLMSCLAVMGSFSLLVYNINTNLEESFSETNKITVFCDVNCSEEQVTSIRSQIEKLDNVDSVQFVSKDEAFQEERLKYEQNYPDLFQSLDENGQNPYPDEFIITYADNNEVSTLKYNLNEIEGISKVKSIEEIGNTIENIKNGIIFIFVWFLAILFVVSLFVIINTIKLAVFSRRQEISVMRYVGATNWFITLPFVFEGVIIGIFSSVVAFALQWYTYNYIANTISKSYQIISVVPFHDVMYFVGGGFLAVGIITGIIGSCISLSKYLRA